MTKTAAAVFMFLCSLAAASGSLRVDEAASKVILLENRSAVSLAVENPSDHAVPARFTLDWLKPDGVADSTVERELSVPPGRSTAVVAFPLPAKSREDPMWLRLRYRIRCEGAETGGTLALANFAENVFELRISAASEARKDEVYRVPVNVRHPVLGKPVARVTIGGTLDLDDGPVKAQTLSDKDGLATLEFHIPQGAEDDKVDLHVYGQLGDFRQEVEAEVSFADAIYLHIDTDKPLYQPGQTLHMRLLGITKGDRAAAEVPLTVRVEDPEDQAAFITHLTTNRFGVASTDWQIPDNVRLGDYRVRAGTNEDDCHCDPLAIAEVKISRYDLPNFMVSATPDRRYYLPGQNAEIEVRADYLFGKPVPGGHVRLVRETSREWNYRDQKLDIEEGESQEGTADSSGRFVAHWNLDPSHKDLKKYKRFEDLHFTAYVRDPAGGRTEQRRFDLRVTREAIHVYVIEPYGKKVAYISTSYADGSPAPCQVRIDGGVPVITNRYGLARITLPEGAESIEMQADDGRGAEGRWQENVRDWDTGPLRLRAGKTLYKPGEPIRVEIGSSEPLPAVILEVFAGGRRLESRWLSLGSGAVTVDLPWSKEFVHEVTISVSADGLAHHGAYETVLFPANRELSLGVGAGQAQYRPGDEAVVSFDARLPDGSTTETALGVAVVDAAVGERAQTDSASDGRSRYSRRDQLAGVTRQDLYQLDCSKPFPEDLDLLAEVMLAFDLYRPNMDDDVLYEEDMPREFRPFFDEQLKPVMDALRSRYNKDYHHPQDMQTLKRELLEAGIAFDSVRDPWETPYSVKFETSGDVYHIEFFSAGPDKRFDTSDDFETGQVQLSHFKPFRDSIERTIKTLGAFPQTEADARASMLKAGIDLDQLRDAWGTAYHATFRIQGERGYLDFNSAGPDRVFGTPDDVLAASIFGSYFTGMRDKLASLLDAAKSYPRNEREWNRLLRSAGLYPLKDLWGRNIYATFKQRFDYIDVRKPYAVAKNGETPETRFEIVPTTQKYFAIHLRSAGPDGIEGTFDDFELAAFERAERIRAKHPAGPRDSKSPEPANTGSITGRITDASGAVIVGANVRAVAASGTYHSARSGPAGIYFLDALEPGVYTVTFYGFQKTQVVKDVTVDRQKSTLVDAKLEAGNMDALSVGHAAQGGSGSAFSIAGLRSDMATINTTSSERVYLPQNGRDFSDLAYLVPGGSAGPQSTPRLREYFPETLLWAPSVETGPDGKTQLKFHLADNITTWQLHAIGSTLTGEIGTATTNIRAFQPFFVDHDPPRVLTQGDQIQLPVTIRNYLNQPQSVEVSVKPESWFKLLGEDRHKVAVNAGAWENVVFPFRAIGVAVDGKQRVTAAGPAANDAIEKPVTVHPDGNEINETLNSVLRGRAAFDLAVPANVIPGSLRGEMKIYPNLISHVIDSIEGILQRPRGCTEQTISSAYPSLMLLRYLKSTGRQEPSLREKALRYVQSGVDRLLGYRAEGGGFTYWGRGAADIGLSAYALNFLREAQEFVVIDDRAIENTRKWLAKQQIKDGTWPAYNWKREIDARRTVFQTAEVVVALSGKESQDSVAKALKFLAGQDVDEPYAIAAIAEAARRSDDAALAEKMLERLRPLARREGDLAYWNLESNTPFYGWGLAGRLETTALAVRALVGGGQAADRPLIDSAMLFLLRNKDRDGVWWSTQATVKVLEAILAANSTESFAGDSGPVEIMVDDRLAATLPLPASSELTGPVRVDISQYLAPGTNRVEVKRAGGNQAQAQLAASYYEPWPKKALPAKSGPLRLKVSFDKTAVKPGDAVMCTVQAERAGFRGYGMMLAEIGLPPGADVDRQSLDAAVEASGYALSHYDILPDRVIAYLWPTAGETRFSFRFRPRFAMQAKTASSQLYDYYNPDARVVAAPVDFRVKTGESKGLR
jgi:uncharacterized protein YfaS (alpha-2-macroglobulin family)